MKSGSVLFIGFAALSLTHGQAVFAQQTASPAPPPQASDAGFSTLVFDDEFNTLNLAPSGNDSGTYNWYPGIWFESPPPSSSITAKSGVLDLNWSKRESESTGLYDTSIEGESSAAAAGQTFRYGYFEARMKWDNVSGAWPAFWMLPVQALEGDQNGGEIDIFEGQGGSNAYYGTLHTWNGSTETWVSNPSDFSVPRGTDFTQWHTYGILWVPGSGGAPGTITWYFDNNEVGAAHTTNSNNSLFDQQDYFLILGSQEGANWTYGQMTSQTPRNIHLYVDWVHVWEK